MIKFTLEFHLLDDFGEVIRVSKSRWDKQRWLNDGRVVRTVRVPYRSPIADCEDAPF